MWDLGIADMPGEDEFLSLVRGIPVFDPGTIRVTAPGSAFATLLGKRFREDQLAREIRRQTGGSFKPALPGYIRVIGE